MQFQLVKFPYGSRQSAQFDESLMQMAARQGPTASIWEAAQGLVVPRTYQRYEKFAATCEAFAKRLWPVTVRLSGGGIVPQGPGIINLSLAYAMNGPPLEHSDTAYAFICGVIQKALERYGIQTRPSTADGSFCDGRFNLIYGPGNMGKKIAGTAQLWRRQRGAGPTGATIQVVLVHALILAGVDTAYLTSKVNLFEQALDSGKHYDPARVASLHECQNQDACPREEFIRSLTGTLLQEVENCMVPSSKQK